MLWLLIKIEQCFYTKLELLHTVTVKFKHLDGDVSPFSADELPSAKKKSLEFTSTWKKNLNWLALLQRSVSPRNLKSFTNWRWILRSFWDRKRPQGLSCSGYVCSCVGISVFCGLQDHLAEYTPGERWLQTTKLQTRVNWIMQRGAVAHLIGRPGSFHLSAAHIQEKAVKTRVSQILFFPTLIPRNWKMPPPLLTQPNRGPGVAGHRVSLYKHVPFISGTDVDLTQVLS